MYIYVDFCAFVFFLLMPPLGGIQEGEGGLRKIVAYIYTHLYIYIYIHMYVYI